MSLLALEVGLTDSRYDNSLKCRPLQITGKSFLSRTPMTGIAEIDALVRRRKWQNAESILVRILSEAGAAKSAFSSYTSSPTSVAAATPPSPTTTTKPDDSPEIQNTKLMLAYVLRQVGRPRDAEQLDSDVLETRQRLFGSVAQDTLIAMNHLASDIKQQPERLLEGLALEKRVLETAVQVYCVDAAESKHHRKTSSSTKSTTSTTSTTSSSSLSSSSSTATTIPTPTTPPKPTALDHSSAMDILFRMCHLADTYFMENQAAHAAKLHETVLRLCTTSLGPGHPYTIAVMDSTGRDYVSQGRLTQAMRLLQDAVEAGRVHLGARDPTTLRCVVHLAEVHGRITAEGEGKVPDARVISYLKQGAQILEESLGPNNCDTISLKYYLAVAYARLDGRFQDSEALQDQVLYWCRNPPEIHAETAHLIVRNLSLLYRQLGRMDKARQVENEFGPIRRASS